MGTEKIFITREIPGAGVEKLKEVFDVTISPLDRDLTRDEIINMAAGAQGLVSVLNDTIDKGLMDRLPGLRIIANYAVGFNNVEIEYAREKGIAVTNTPGVLTQATADIAMSLILCLARRIVEGDRLLRRGGFKGFYPTFFLGVELENKVLGIYGMGRIGKAVAKRAVAHGMKIIYHNKKPCKEGLIDFPASYVSFEELLEKSDFVSVHAPLTKETRHRFTIDEFREMKRGVYFVNTARGPLVKEVDLVWAIKEGYIAGAGLDVYEFEPEVNPDFVTLDNVVLLPHIGSAAREVREKMAMIVVGNLIAFFNGEPPPDRVN